MIDSQHGIDVVVGRHALPFLPPPLFAHEVDQWAIRSTTAASYLISESKSKNLLKYDRVVCCIMRINVLCTARCALYSQ